MALGVQFEEPYIPPKLTRGRADSGLITKIFVRLGLGKDPNDAKKAMIVTAAAAFLISLYFFTHMGPPHKELTSEQAEAARMQLESAAAASQ